jgi:hypothetical protein
MGPVEEVVLRPLSLFALGDVPVGIDAEARGVEVHSRQSTDQTGRPCLGFDSNGAGIASIASLTARHVMPLWAVSHSRAAARSAAARVGFAVFRDVAMAWRSARRCRGSDPGTGFTARGGRRLARGWSR